MYLFKQMVGTVAFVFLSVSGPAHVAAAETKMGSEESLWGLIKTVQIESALGIKKAESMFGVKLDLANELTSYLHYEAAVPPASNSPVSWVRVTVIKGSDQEREAGVIVTIDPVCISEAALKKRFGESNLVKVLSAPIDAPSGETHVFRDSWGELGFEYRPANGEFCIVAVEFKSNKYFSAHKKRFSEAPVPE